jgi:hypothetical protein
MAAHVWVNGIAIAVVVVSLVKAWRSTSPRRKKSAKSAKTQFYARRVGGQRVLRGGHHYWGLLRNEAEIARRRAADSDASKASGAGPDGRSC